MADKTPTTTTTPDASPAGFLPVPLLSNSYNFQDLLKASDHVDSLKTDEGRSNALGELATKSASLQDVITGIEAPAVPEGTEMAKTTDSTGRETTAAVAIPDKTSDEKPA
jgi:hypothetical protein